MNKQDPLTSSDPKTLHPWASMRLQHLGQIRDIVQGGQGKVTIATGDPGEYKKVPSHEPGG